MNTRLKAIEKRIGNVRGGIQTFRLTREEIKDITKRYGGLTEKADGIVLEVTKALSDIRLFNKFVEANPRLFIGKALEIEKERYQI
jgi:hypothetical protein